MPAPDSEPLPRQPIDWESFYCDYRKPGYIPGYEIQTQLGSGAFGIVFKATKESIGKPYAIKFLKVDDIEIKDAVVRELDAVRHFAQVDHPNLVSIEDMGEVDGIPYIVMAFAGDSTLRKRIDDGEIEAGDLEAVRRVFLQVARGVQALHEHSLVHFDVKPANVYLKGEVARIGDYGLSKLVTDSRNSLSMGRGTPYYMAPELLRRKGDSRSDIYALGVLLFELLCGHPPFQGDSEWEVLKQHEEAEPELPPSVVEPERSVILRALAKRPEDRFDSVAAMRVALGDAAACGHTDAATIGFAPADQPQPRHPSPPLRARLFDSAHARHGAGDGSVTHRPAMSLLLVLAFLLIVAIATSGLYLSRGFDSPEAVIEVYQEGGFMEMPAPVRVISPQQIEPAATATNATRDGSRVRLLRLAQSLSRAQARILRSIVQRSIADDYDDDFRAAHAIVDAAPPQLESVLESLVFDSDDARYWRELILQVITDHREVHNALQHGSRNR